MASGAIGSGAGVSGGTNSTHGVALTHAATAPGIAVNDGDTRKSSFSDAKQLHTASGVADAVSGASLSGKSVGALDSTASAPPEKRDPFGDAAQRLADERARAASQVGSHGAFAIAAPQPIASTDGAANAQTQAHHEGNESVGASTSSSASATTSSSSNGTNGAATSSSTPSNPIVQSANLPALTPTATNRGKFKAIGSVETLANGQQVVRQIELREGVTLETGAVRTGALGERLVVCGFWLMSGRTWRAVVVPPNEPIGGRVHECAASSLKPFDEADAVRAKTLEQTTLDALYERARSFAATKMPTPAFIAAQQRASGRAAAAAAALSIHSQLHGGGHKRARASSPPLAPTLGADHTRAASQSRDDKDNESDVSSQQSEEEKATKPAAKRSKPPKPRARVQPQRATSRGRLKAAAAAATATRRARAADATAAASTAAEDHLLLQKIAERLDRLEQPAAAAPAAAAVPALPPVPVPAPLPAPLPLPPAPPAVAQPAAAALAAAEVPAFGPLWEMMMARQRLAPAPALAPAQQHPATFAAAPLPIAAANQSAAAVRLLERFLGMMYNNLPSR